MDNYEVTLSDFIGQSILKTTINKQQSSLDVSDMLPGYYILTIKDRTGQKIFTQKMIKQ